MERPGPPPPRPSIFEPIALIVVGLLIFIPSGLCTGALSIAPMIPALSNPKDSLGAAFAPIALIIGGPFVLGGGALLWLGVKNLRDYFRKADEG